MSSFSPRLPQDLFGDLPVCRTRLVIGYISGSKPQGFTGSAWRGIMGPGLQKTFCPDSRKKTCPAVCLWQDQCPYFNLFRKKSSLPGKNKAPKGYILQSLPVDGRRCEILEITLFGNCRHYLPCILDVLHKQGRHGLTHHRCRFEIVREESLAPLQGTSADPIRLRHWIEANEEQIDRKFVFQNPVRLRKKKKLVGKMDWPFFFMSLARKLTDLNCIYNKAVPLDEKEKKKVEEELEDMFQSWDNINDALKWHDLWRYSSSQKKKIPLGGLSGEVFVTRCSREQYAWFQAAGLVGVGKSAVMGLGKIAEEDNHSRE